MNTNVTTDTYFKLDKIIYYMNDKITERISEGSTEEDLEEAYIELGKAVIQKDEVETQLRENMNDEQLAAFDDLIKLHERQRSLEYRLHYMENELEKMLDTKRRLDETLEYGERVLDLVEETIRKLDEQEAAES